jgi:hypothetical protein
MKTIWFDKVKTCIGWNTTDQVWISGLRDWLNSDIQDVIETISTCLVQFKDSQSLMTNARFVQRLHSVLRDWLEGPLSASFDAAYVESRRALVHKLTDAGVTFEDVILMEGIARTQLLDMIQTKMGKDQKERAITARALEKALQLDLTLIHNGYTQIRDAEIERSMLDRFLAITGFSRTLYENLAEAREWNTVQLCKKNP